jgi:uncharacterized protein
VTLVRRLQADLVAAMKAGDRPLVTILRVALAAIANAEAPPIGSASHVAARGATEIDRLVLTDADVDRIIRAEIDDRARSIAEYHQAGAGALDVVDVLRGEIDVLRSYLS